MLAVTRFGIHTRLGTFIGDIAGAGSGFVKLVMLLSVTTYSQGC